MYRRQALLSGQYDRPICDMSDCSVCTFVFCCVPIMVGDVRNVANKRNDATIRSHVVTKKAPENRESAHEL